MQARKSSVEISISKLRRIGYAIAGTHTARTEINNESITLELCFTASAVVFQSSFGFFRSNISPRSPENNEKIIGIRSVIIILTGFIPSIIEITIDGTSEKTPFTIKLSFRFCLRTCKGYTGSDCISQRFLASIEIDAAEIGPIVITKAITSGRYTEIISINVLGNCFGVLSWNAA